MRPFRVKSRLVAAGRWFTRRSRALGSWVASVIGFDEVVIVTALGLIVAGLWPLCVRFSLPGASSLLIPGLVLLWMALPPRNSFIVRTEKPAAIRRAS